MEQAERRRGEEWSKLSTQGRTKRGRNTKGAVDWLTATSLKGAVRP